MFLGAGWSAGPSLHPQGSKEAAFCNRGEARQETPEESRRVWVRVRVCAALRWVGVVLWGLSTEHVA